MADSYDLDELKLIRVSDGWTLDIRNALIDDGLEYGAALDDPPTWTATCTDPDGEVLNAHRFIKRKAGPEYDPFFALDAKGKLVAIDAEVNGRWYRVRQVSVNGDSTVLTLEDRSVQRLRKKYGHRIASRNDVTRAQFSQSLVKALRSENIGFYSRELKVKQPIAKGKSDDKDKDSKDPGISPAQATGIKIKGEVPSAQQLRDIDTALTVADQDKAPERAVVALLAAGIGESNFDRHQKDGVTGTHVGIWQSNQIPADDVAGQAHHFLVGGKSFAEGGAIAASKISVLTIGGIVSKVEISDANGAFYDKYVDEAQAIYDLWSGGALSDIGNSSDSDTYNKPYQFEVEKDEDYWTALTRLAGEVKWRCFVHKDKGDRTVLYFMDDYQLLRGTVQYTFQKSRSEHIDGPSFDFDNTQSFPQEFSVTVLIDRDALAPGDVVDVLELGPATGRWIVSEVGYSYFKPGVSLTLIQPVVPKKEPPHEEAQRDEDSENAAPRTGRKTQHGLGYPLADAGDDLGGVAAHKARPFGNWQSDNAVDIAVPQGTDVFAVDDGTIVKLGGHWDGTGKSNPNGYNVTLKTADNQWFYTHMRHRNSNLAVGDTVRKGQKFGESGAANGVAHLHIGCEHGDPEALLGVK